MTGRLTTSRRGALLVLTAALLVGFRPASAQNVSNVRAALLDDGTFRVEVLYDLTGTVAGGATVSVAFSDDGGSSYSIVPVPGALAGDVGAGVVSGTNRRIVWDATGQPPGACGPSFRAAVTATNPTGDAQEVTVTLPGGVPLVMVRIPAGTFQMGSPATERYRFANEGPVHAVTLTSDYYIGKYEVTQEQWQAVMGSNPSFFTSCGSSCPVERVSWYDIADSGGFVEKLNLHLTSTGQPGAGKLRLPTEAEWERAARATTGTRFSFGDILSCGDVCDACTLAEQYMWWCPNSGGATHPVGQKQPNGYGLYDVHGNVWEWVADKYDGGYYTTSPSANPTGPRTGSDRVTRGGASNSGAFACRSAYRGHLTGDYRSAVYGFRLAMSL